MQEDKKLTNNVILKYKIKQMVKGWLKKVKNSKIRYYVLNEWALTEEAYIKDLELLLNKIQKPLVEEEVLSQFQSNIVFFHLDSMIKLGKQMLLIINRLKDQWHPLHTILSEPLKDLAKYFKIYRQYCANYEKAEIIVSKIKDRPEFIKIMKSLPTGFFIEDYLIKPVNRPTKYKLLLSSYLSKLPKDHKDRENLQQTIETYHKIVEDINDATSHEERLKLVRKLEKKYGNIIEPSRSLKSDFVAFEAITENKCKIYVFNDFLLVVKMSEDQEQRQIMRMSIDIHSFVMKRLNSTQFVNRIMICGQDNCIQLTLPNSQKLDAEYKNLHIIFNNLFQRDNSKRQVINKAYERQKSHEFRSSIKSKYTWKEQKKFSFNMKVTVVGGVRRQYENCQTHLFILKFQLIKTEEIYQIGLYTLDQLKQIEKYFNRLYPSLQIPSLSTKPKGYNSEDIKNNFTRYVELKGIVIENFINFLIRQKEITERPENLLFKLKLCESFWEYFNKESVNCFCESCLKTETLQTIKSYEKEQHNIQRRKDPFCIIKSFHIQNTVAEIGIKEGLKNLKLDHKIAWASSKLKRIDYSLENPNKFGELFSFSVYIPWISSQIQVKIPFVSYNDTVRSAINYIAERQGFKFSRDLNLVAQFNDKQYILDDDEYIWDVVKYMKGEKEDEKEEGRQKTWLGKILDWDWGHNFHQRQKTKLSLRKMIYFDRQTEKKACDESGERYPLIIGEFLAKHKKNFIILGGSQIEVLCALVYGMEEFNAIQGKNSLINEEKLKKYVPYHKIDMISEDFVLKVQKNLDRSIKNFEKITFLYKSFISQFCEKIGWITTYFNIENVYPETLTDGKKQLLLGVSFKKVFITHRKRSSTVLNLLDFPLSQFDYSIVGETLYVKEGEKRFQFVGNNLLFFDRLFNTYKLIVEHS